MQSIVSGVLFSGLWVLVTWLVHRSSSPVGAAVVGAVVGAFSGAIGARERADLWDGVSLVPHQRKVEVVRAAHRGPVPQDEALRQAALQFLRNELEGQPENAWGTLGLLAAVAILAVLISGALVAWVLVALVVARGAGSAVTYRRWRDRERLMASTTASGQLL